MATEDGRELMILVMGLRRSRGGLIYTVELGMV